MNHNALNAVLYVRILFLLPVTSSVSLLVWVTFSVKNRGICRGRQKMVYRNLPTIFSDNLRIEHSKSNNISHWCAPQWLFLELSDSSSHWMIMFLARSITTYHSTIFQSIYSCIFLQWLYSLQIYLVHYAANCFKRFELNTKPLTLTFWKFTNGSDWKYFIKMRNTIKKIPKCSLEKETRRDVMLEVLTLTALGGGTSIIVMTAIDTKEPPTIQRRRR